MLTEAFSLLVVVALRTVLPFAFATFGRFPFCGASTGCGVSSQLSRRRGSAITLVSASMTPASMHSASRPNSP